MAKVAAMPALAAGEREVRPEFTGSAREYFRIWIVNLFFTLVTLGIYSPWAKVRKKRYFYGSTRFDGDSFDYFASPKAILKGRIFAVAVFVVYAFAGELYPDSRYAFWIVFALMLPWLVMRALTFNARNSAFRGLRFDFTAGAKEAIGVYFGMGLLVVVTLGIAFPWFMARQKSFVVSRHALGTSGFECKLTGRQFFGIYFIAGLIVLAIAAPAGAAIAFVAGWRLLPPGYEWLVPVLGSIGIYSGYAIAHAYAQANTANLLWSKATAPGVRFASTLSAIKLARLYIGNIVAIVCSAGLLIPWAVVRTLRYRLANFAMIVVPAQVYRASPTLPPVGATGQELGDIFNLDLGI